MKGDGYHMIAHLLLVPKSIVEHVNILKRLFSFFGNTVRVDRDLKQRRRRRQRELQKRNRLRLAKKKKPNLHVHHAFLYIALPSLHDNDVKFHVLWRT